MESSDTLLVETTFIKPSETDSIRPITVYQALQAERLHDDVEFMIDGAIFSKVLLVTHVLLSSNTNNVRGSYSLEDGTGRIYGSRTNRVRQDPVTFSAMLQQFDGVLACVMGKLVQHGHHKLIDIESMVAAGYYQAMFHTLECMRMNLTIGRHRGPALGTSTGSIIDVLMQASNAEKMVNANELEGEVPHTHDSIIVDSGAFDRSRFSFCDLPGGNVSFPQVDAPLLQPYADHIHGSSSKFTPTRRASQLPTLLPASEPDITHSDIVHVAHPRTVARTPSPPPFIGSLFRIRSRSTQQNSQLSQLTDTQVAIVSGLSQLQGNTPYGVWIDDVFKRMTRVIEITREEFMTDIEWLLEEAYIVRPLDDGRIALTPRASA